jgi:transcriptional regulator with XRE-family HTH domain
MPTHRSKGEPRLLNSVERTKEKAPAIKPAENLRFVEGYSVSRRHPMSEEHIAKNIRSLRKNRGLTLQDLEEVTGLSKGYLSKIERSEKSPPYTTMNKVAKALGVDVSFLISANVDQIEDPRVTFVKRNKGKFVEGGGKFYGYQYQSLASGKPGKNMVPYIIEPSHDLKPYFQRDGEEFIYVLEGTHEFNYDGKIFIMEAGDCIYYESNVPHSGRSLGERRAKLLAITYYYKRF